MCIVMPHTTKVMQLRQVMISSQLKSRKQKQRRGVRSFELEAGDMFRGVLLKLSAVPQSNEDPQLLLDSPCGSLTSTQMRQNEQRDPWLLKASKAAAKLEPRSSCESPGRRTWYTTSSSRITSSRIASAPSSPVGNVGPLTRKTWFVAPQLSSRRRVNLLLPHVIPAITAGAATSPTKSPPREPPVPAAAPRKKWYMSAPSPSNKAAAAAARAEQSQQQPAATTEQAPAPSARKTWYRPPLSRSASSSKQAQQRAQQPVTVQQQAQKEQQGAAVDNSTHNGSKIWRRRSAGSAPVQPLQKQEQQQQVQLQEPEQQKLAQTVEVEQVANANATATSDDDEDEDDSFPTPVPEALLHRDAQWPAGSKVRQRFNTQQHLLHSMYRVHHVAAIAADTPTVTLCVAHYCCCHTQALQQALLAHSKRSHCAENYVFIASVRAYKSKLSTGDTAGADAQRAVIIEKFINAGELQVNLPSWTVEETLTRAARKDPRCFDAAADEICKLMSTDIWPKFIKSVEYLSLTAVERSSAYSTALVLRSAAAAAAVTGCAAGKKRQQQHTKINVNVLPLPQMAAPAHCSALTDVDDGNSSSTSSTSTSSTSCASSHSSMTSSSSMSALNSTSSNSISRRSITSSKSMGALMTSSSSSSSASASTSGSIRPLRRSSVDSPRPGAFTTNGQQHFFNSNSSDDSRYNSNNSNNNKWQKLQCDVEAVANGLKVLGAAQQHLAERSALLLD
jgi:Regulator of G protein signaling domain